MASHRLLIKKSAVKELESVPRKDRGRLVTKLRGLSSEPRPPGCERLSGQDLYRMGQGNYRVLYQIVDNAKTVTVIKIGHRRDVYR